jgi:hypothetical protein
VVNGTFYSDHRHDDIGNLVIYALGAPLSIDWGSMYSPQSAGGYMHSTVMPESNIGQPWNSDSPAINKYVAPWRTANQDSFLAFLDSGQVTSSFQSQNGAVWNRSVYSIHPNPNSPVILIDDSFRGTDATAAKIFSLNLMAQGAVETPSGLITPPLRLWDSAGTRQELPSAAGPLSLAPGLNRFRFTGQWGIDWDLYAITSDAPQAVIGNWAHNWAPSPEQSQFRKANGTPFQERQQILRLRNTGPVRTLILPRRKNQTISSQVSQTGGQITIKSGTEQTTIGSSFYSFTNGQKTEVGTFDSQPASAYGIKISGGAAEVSIANGHATITAHGPAGKRTIILPGSWTAVAPLTFTNGSYVLDYAGGTPVQITM